MEVEFTTCLYGNRTMILQQSCPHHPDDFSATRKCSTELRTPTTQGPVSTDVQVLRCASRIVSMAPEDRGVLWGSRGDFWRELKRQTNRG